MGNVLYRKYRSQSFDELVGQSHITETLQNAVSSGNVAHAYLFSGPRGVGKTSMARILARHVNSLSVKEAQGHIDIIEIDAASNRRIDEVRDLREHIHTAPSQAKYKVYIIDEVHMLTKEAFNALLKTLEEPPDHAIFILATTEIHKIPETIISRTQRFTFKPIAPKAMVSHLQHIAKKESIHIQKEALLEIATHAKGSFRDAISLLDQIKSTVNDTTSTTAITKNDVLEIVGATSEDIIDVYLHAFDSADIRAVLQQLQRSLEAGHDAKYIAAQLYERMLLKIQGELDYNDATVKFLRALLLVPGSYSPQNSLEVALLEYCTSEKNVNKNEAVSPATGHVAASSSVLINQAQHDKRKQSVSAETNTVKKDEQSIEKSSTTQMTNEARIGPEKKDTTSNMALSDIEAVWQEVLIRLKGRHNTLYGMARKVIPSVQDDGIVLYCSFPFHVKRLSDAHHNKILASIISDIVGSNVSITCVLKKRVRQPHNNHRPRLPDVDEEIEAISDIFGGAEVVES